MDRKIALTRRAARIIKEIEMGAPDTILANEVALCVKAMFEHNPEAMAKALQQIYVQDRSARTNWLPPESIRRWP